MYIVDLCSVCCSPCLGGDTPPNHSNNIREGISARHNGILIHPVQGTGAFEATIIFTCIHEYLCM